MNITRSLDGDDGTAMVIVAARGACADRATHQASKDRSHRYLAVRPKIQVTPEQPIYDVRNMSPQSAVIAGTLART